ncbi:MAG: EAL domain-containing protein [Nitrosomonas sp.]|nr:MAG: EAL domain-containing protein [Nitrosomonas sp.]
MSIKKFLTFGFASLSVLLFLLLLTVFHSRQIQLEITEKEHNRLHAITLVQELFQSSEDLTRVAQAYVVTGIPAYKTYFYQILAIRNGLSPRPHDFSSTYWHLEGVGKLPVSRTGEAAALIDLLRRQNLTPEEFQSLRQFQLNSDRLVTLEEKAFAAAERRFDNGQSEFTALGESDKNSAAALLWSEMYADEKVNTMLPLKQLHALVHERTSTELITAQTRLQQSLFITGAIVILLMAGAMFAIRYCKRNILNPLHGLTEKTTAIAGGIFSERCVTAGSNELAELEAGVNRMADVVAHKISLQEQTQDRLLRSEARLKEVLHLAEIGNWELDLLSNKLYWSDEIYSIFGIDQTKRSASYAAFLGVVHPEDRNRVDQSYRHSLETHSPYEIAHRLLLADDRIKWVNAHCTTFYDDQGKPVRSVGTVQDITARMLAEETIHLYASVFEQSGEAIVITDADSKILATNAAFHRLTGYDQQAALAQNPYTLLSAQPVDEKNPFIWRDLVKHNFWQGELSLLHRDGHSYIAWLSITAVRNPHNKITHFIACFTDFTAHKAALNRIHHLAHHDTLTDLPNRFTLIERLKQAIHSAQRHKEKVAVMFIDLDRFKIINDTLGHHIGDLLLIEVAQRLQTCIRNNDIVARLGGDEFVVALLELGHTDTTFHIADKMLHALEQPYLLEGHEIYSTPSVGIAFYPDNGDDADEVLKNADTAMYHAKAKGRNNYQFFESSMNQANLERLELERDMRVALEREEFELHFQPKVNANSLQISGVEALVRWRHPSKGLISPLKFIPLAEESGLIAPLGEWIIRTACRQIKDWHERGMAYLQISINLSQRQLHRPNLASLIQNIVTTENINPAKLEFEITESMAMDDPQKTIESLNTLHQIGVQLALDDFGTGYSSMSYLKQMPINCLKLDRTYVKDIETGPSDAAVCAASISLAHNLGLEVVAEGVETAKQIEYLKILGCDKIQGYYFSKPLPPAEAENFIKRWSTDQSTPAAPQPAEILIIDDDQWTCELYQHILKAMGHKATTFIDPIKGLELLRQDPFRFKLILLDMLIPSMPGMDLIKSIREMNANIPLIVVTSFKQDAVRKALRTLDPKLNLLPDINYLILEKPLTADHIQGFVSKILSISPD